MTVVKTAMRHVRILRSRGSEAGATMVEYGLLVALIALVAMGGASVLGNGVAAGFDRATTALSGLEEDAPADEPDGAEPQSPVAAAAEGDDAAAGDGDAAGGGGATSKGKSADAPAHGGGVGGGRNH